MARVWMGPDDEPSRRPPVDGDRPPVGGAVTGSTGPARPTTARFDLPGEEPDTAER